MQVARVDARLAQLPDDLAGGFVLAEARNGNAFVAEEDRVLGDEQREPSRFFSVGVFDQKRFAQPHDDPAS